MTGEPNHKPLEDQIDAIMANKQWQDALRNANYICKCAAIMWHELGTVDVPDWARATITHEYVDSLILHASQMQQELLRQQDARDHDQL